MTAHTSIRTVVRRRILALTGVLIVAALTVSCSAGAARTLPTPAAPTPRPTVAADGFATSGYRVHTDARDHYGRWELKDIDAVIPLDDSNPNTLVDDDGALIVHWPGYDDPVYHPVGFLNYTMNAIHAHDLTGDAEYLRRAIATATALRDGGTTVDGALWFAYPFEFAPHGEPALTMQAPWWSGMAQGQALSAFSRLYARTGDAMWRTAAEAVFATFTAVPASGGPWFVDTSDGHLWFEEYAGEVAPLHVVNGHIYALLGLADYDGMTADPVAQTLFDGGATTILETFGTWRVPDGISYYCASQYCADSAWQPPSYHRGVSAQLVTLAELTGDDRFRSDAELLDQDYARSGATG
ncbi:D-glucuronyl C5-epimerase family protein [uncultured Leifsonia sp.]|uniref:D-glucuronyl C5-epimerase family protein n=1 Tax=uncultured Leifsonia sp. TaxID=340359 RepID=UPI0028D3160B|nr:D-glucuronyl C5-epimerase family protein [uncultured Leifsonia sp.]